MDEVPARPASAWRVFLAYLGAFVTIVALSLVAAVVVQSMYPELPERAVLDGLPGLLAGGVASSTALILTVLAAVRPFEPARLRLVPGWESGRCLAVMVLGMLALGQALDSLTTLAGLHQHGSMVVIRRALASAAGAELFAAVVIVGLMSGIAEEIFFRGYMLSRLRELWSPRAAIVATSVAFGLMHLEWLHAVLACVLGLYLGYVTELAGSALPAIVCHVVNNTVFTLLTALVGAVEGVALNAALLGAATVVVAASVWWLRRALPPL